MNALLQERRPGTGQPQEFLDANARKHNLQRAVHTLRAIRRRYEADRIAHPEARRYGVQVAVSGSDMAWIAAAIEALEMSAGGGPR